MKTLHQLSPRGNLGSRSPRLFVPSAIESATLLITRSKRRSGSVELEPAKNGEAKSMRLSVASNSPAKMYYKAYFPKNLLAESSSSPSSPNKFQSNWKISNSIEDIIRKSLSPSERRYLSSHMQPKHGIEKCSRDHIISTFSLIISQ